MESKIGHVYCIKNKINNDIYARSTTLNLEKRFDQHFRDLDRNDRSNGIKLYPLIDKLGKEQFYIKLIEDVFYSDKRELRKREGEMDKASWNFELQG